MDSATPRPPGRQQHDDDPRLAAGELQAAFRRARQQAAAVPRAVRAQLAGKPRLPQPPAR